MFSKLWKWNGNEIRNKIDINTNVSKQYNHEIIVLRYNTAIRKLYPINSGEEHQFLVINLIKAGVYILLFNYIISYSIANTNYKTIELESEFKQLQRDKYKLLLATQNSNR